VPIAVDGGTQLFALRESNWLLRTLTGALFGFAVVWITYPHVESAMQEVIEDELALQDRAKGSEHREVSF